MQLDGLHCTRWIRYVKEPENEVTTTARENLYIYLFNELMRIYEWDYAEEYFASVTATSTTA